MNIALINYRNQEEVSNHLNADEDDKLKAFLGIKGHVVERVIWSDQQADWKRYDLIVIKSPWDYHEHVRDFHIWLEGLQTLNIKILNPVPMIVWNSDKHYLKTIAASGLPVIKGKFLDKGTKPNLAELFHIFKCSEIIIKPCVSASARNTTKITESTFEKNKSGMYEQLEQEDYIAQPFMEEVLDGEWSFLFFNGKYSHSVLKIPQKDDFRVQQQFGGTFITADPLDSYIKSAQKYVNAFARGSLYARVDGIICKGELLLMELELIEPYLFLDSCPQAYENYYNALIALSCNN